jgi:hypothetical protein
MITKDIPQSAEFAFDVTRVALGEQLARIDSLDSRAGILLAADGIFDSKTTAAVAAGVPYRQWTITDMLENGQAAAIGYLAEVSS